MSMIEKISCLVATFACCYVSFRIGRDSSKLYWEGVGEAKGFAKGHREGFMEGYGAAKKVEEELKPKASDICW